MFKREIKSYVLRQGRMTEAQERAFAEYWQTWGVDFNSEKIITQEALFPVKQNLVLEIGFGNGASLLEMARTRPQENFLGIEVYKNGVGRVLQALAQENLPNLRVMRHDAVEVLQKMIAEASLDRVQVYFPDPWHKARHHKRRLLQAPFLELLQQKIKANGELHCATDWENYAENIRDLLINNPQWQNIGNPDGYANRPDFRPLTKFEARGQKLGHGVWDLRYLRV